MTMPDTVHVPPTDPVRSFRGSAWLLVVLGVICVVLGGLIAAVTGPLKLADGSWLAAYLVLVNGVAQYAMGRMPLWLEAPPLTPLLSWTQLASWNVGSALVVAGTLTDLPILVGIGGALLMIGLGIAWRTVRSYAKPGRAARLAYRAYRCLLLMLLVSIPIGVALANLRAAG